MMQSEYLENAKEDFEMWLSVYGCNILTSSPASWLLDLYVEFLIRLEVSWK